MQRICILNTDSLTKSGKSTDSFTLLGKIYRFFAEIRRVKDRLRGPEFLSLKAALCLSKFTQTWREKPANSSDLACFSGKSFRHGEKIRHVSGRIRLRRARTACLARNPSTSSVSAQETRHPHEIDTGSKSLSTYPRATDLQRCRRCARTRH